MVSKKRTSNHGPTATHSHVQASPKSKRIPGKLEAYNDFFSLEENLNACFTMSLKQLEDRFAEHPSLSEPWQELKTYLRKPGKRVRPMLFLSSYYLFSGKAHIPPMPAFRIACALEIFHAFALVHDDIIDESHSRRGAPALHVRMSSGGSMSSENATHLAIVIGDILFGYAMECFLDPGLDPVHTQQAARYFLRTAQDTGIGQAVEIAHLAKSLEEVHEDEILHTYYLKTTRYTIECPLVLGAMLAGASSATTTLLNDFARPLGLAFQIENDLHEVELLAKGDSELAYDLQKGVKTLYLKKLYNAFSPEDRQLLCAFLADKATEAQKQQLWQQLNQHKVRERMALEIRDAFRRADQILAEAPLSSTQRKGLSRMIAFLRGNSHHSEAHRTQSEDIAMAE